MSDQEHQILLTNDDGIRSPGLWAAAEALSQLGFVTVAAPREQSSGAGRSMPSNSDGRIHEQQVTVGGKTWKVYAVGGSPAQVVQHAILEIIGRPPDLVVSGINYGENLTTSVTISGTVGAALEGAALGAPALAISLELNDPADHMRYSIEVDFNGAAYFTALFGAMLLQKALPEDVDVLKVDVPITATPETPWRMSHLSRGRYYTPVNAPRARLDDAAPMGFEIAGDVSNHQPDSDAYVLRVERQVAVTPLSLDMTSRVELDLLDKLLRG